MWEIIDTAVTPCNSPLAKEREWEMRWAGPPDMWSRGLLRSSTFPEDIIHAW
jgi:hypothetical protein